MNAARPDPAAPNTRSAPAPDTPRRRGPRSNLATALFAAAYGVDRHRRARRRLDSRQGPRHKGRAEGRARHFGRRFRHLRCGDDPTPGELVRASGQRPIAHRIRTSIPRRRRDRRLHGHRLRHLGAHLGAALARRRRRCDSRRRPRYRRAASARQSVRRNRHLDGASVPPRRPHSRPVRRARRRVRRHRALR